MAKKLAVSFVKLLPVSANEPVTLVDYDNQAEEKIIALLQDAVKRANGSAEIAEDALQD